MRVIIRVETHTGEVEVSEESLRNTWAGDGETVDTVLERAATKIRRSYQTIPIVTQNIEGGVTLSDTNRALLHRAYDDGDGNSFSIVPSAFPGYFEGVCDGNKMMEGTEVNEILYSICPNSGGGTVSVLRGDQILQNEMGRLMETWGEAREYIQRVAHTQ